MQFLQKNISPNFYKTTKTYSYSSIDLFCSIY